jgi:two-component system, cell cycle response regulator
VDTLAGLAPRLESLVTPWLGLYRAADHQLLFPGDHDLGSIAILPLLRQQRLIGVLNFASDDPEHLARREDGEFLAHLAVIAAYCLENTINRGRLLRSGLTDVLTGWHNRRYLMTRLREELARARRDEGTLSCLMLDVDHFKEVNDRFGHLVGDQVLREIAQRVEAQVRASDVTARYGGEEFALLLPQTPAPTRPRCWPNGFARLWPRSRSGGRAGVSP